jgi:hypothetical protein
MSENHVDPEIHRHAIVENRPRLTEEELTRARAWLGGERQDEYQAMFYRGNQSDDADAAGS